MKSKLRPLGAKFDGKSRVSNETYRKNWNEIFKKITDHNAEEIIHGVDPKDNEDDFLYRAEKEKKELEESYQESRRQTKERKEKDGN